MRDSGMVEGEKLRSLHEQKLFLKEKIMTKCVLCIGKK